MQQHRPFSRATWNIYLAFLAVRLFIAFSPGYVHPDEFFQSAEITAGEYSSLLYPCSHPSANPFS
jgi:hypothetical protein